MIRLYHEIQETIEAGLIPPEDRWQALAELAPPWGTLSYESLHELRENGGAVLPTLVRLKTLAEASSVALSKARARSAQAFIQAMTCLALVPVFGGVLYLLMPGLDAHLYFWCFACLAALMFGAAGAMWIISISENARWGGLSHGQRPWILAAQCAGERFLAMVRSGSPPDLAWARAFSLLSREASGLAVHWRASVWDVSKNTNLKRLRGYSAASILINAGESLRKAIQVSLMEGRPCTERAEAVLTAMCEDINARIDQELSLISTKALKPLFICVAPALLGLLVSAFYICWVDSAGGFF